VTCDKFCEEEADIDRKKDINPRRPREAHRRSGGRGRGQGSFRALAWPETGEDLRT
jgi:hypothetical protein